LIFDNFMNFQSLQHHKMWQICISGHRTPWPSW
jgi:hypothetical protein